VAEASIENAMEFDIFGGTQSIMDSEGKNASFGMLAKCSASMVGSSALNCRWRNNAGWHLLWSMETVDWDTSKGIRGRDSKNAVTNGYVAMTIGGDETSATGSVGSKRHCTRRGETSCA
jgi:hypothetical protein